MNTNIKFINKFKESVIGFVLGYIFIFTNSATANSASKSELLKEIEFTFGGMVKLDMAATTSGINGIDDALGLYTADLLFADESKGIRVGLNAKESKLYVGITKNNTPIGPIKVYMEANFTGEGSANGNSIESYSTNLSSFVLRHAYIETNGFLFGQTYSTFVDFEGYLDSIDFAAQTSAVFIRQAQIRYTKKSDDFTYQFALENATSNLGDNLITDDQRFPDFVARVDWDPEFGHFSLTGILREIRIDNGVYEAHETTGGISATYSVTLIPDKLDFMMQYIRGGIGHIGAYSAYSDGVVLDIDSTETSSSDSANSAKRIKAIDLRGGTIGFTFHWSDRFKSIVMGSWNESLDPGLNQQMLGTGHAVDSAQSFQTNLLYLISDELKVGLEYKNLKGELTDGKRPNVDRLQFSVIYSF